MTDSFLVARRMMLLDTASLYFRAFFGVPDSFRAPDGTPVNAVRGLLDFISRLVGEYAPDDLVCCWDDDWRPQWRVDLIPSYKAHRVAEEVEGAPDVEQVPDPLSLQIPVIRELLDALGIATVGAPGYEADDVIGTLAARAAGPVDVVTGDRDLFQVVDDARGVRVLYVARGVAKHERVTAEVVREKYGVGPEQYADFASLRGDASDGLPGVAGIGEKTAAKLLMRYGTIEALTEGHKLTDAGLAYLAVAPKVVRVATDVALPAFDASLDRVPADPTHIEELAERWGVESAVRRLLTTLEKVREGK